MYMGERNFMDETILLYSDDFKVNEPKEFFDGNRDFTSLEAWKKCRDVKLFFL